VAPDGSTAGTQYIDVFVPDGQNAFYFVTQGVEEATTPVSVGLTASADGFIDGTTTVNVVQPAVRINGLAASTTISAADDPFVVQVGIPVSGNTNVRVQRVRFGGSALTAIIQSSVPAVGELVTTAFSGAAVDVQIQPGQYSSPSTVAAGGVAFTPLGAGITAVNTSVPGFITTTNGSVEVVVSEIVLLNKAISDDQTVSGGGGGALDPYLLIIGMLYVVLINSRRRKTTRQ
jgi:hypothetical protein